MTTQRNFSCLATFFQSEKTHNMSALPVHLVREKVLSSIVSLQNFVQKGQRLLSLLSIRQAHSVVGLYLVTESEWMNILPSQVCLCEVWPHGPALEDLLVQQKMPFGHVMLMVSTLLSLKLSV